MRKLEQTFQMEGRKIALLIDNWPGHLSAYDLTNVKLIFLPRNTTSVLQPMDLGVIRSLKLNYRGRVIHQLWRALDKTKTMVKNIYSPGDENTSIFMESCASTNHCQLF